MTKERQRWQPLAIAGICLGAAAGVKWNGLGFLLGIYLIWLVAWLVKLGSATPLAHYRFLPAKQSRKIDGWQTPLSNAAQLNWPQVVVYLVLIPLVTYCLIWIPHLLMNPQLNFWQVHWQILIFHQSIGNSEEVHPYCSSWFTWLLMWRPIAYYYQVTNQGIRDVHAMGNPILWWLSTAAILALLMLLGIQFFSRKILSTQRESLVYLLINYRYLNKF